MENILTNEITTKAIMVEDGLQKLLKDKNSVFIRMVTINDKDKDQKFVWIVNSTSNLIVPQKIYKLKGLYINEPMKRIHLKINDVELIDKPNPNDLIELMSGPLFPSIGKNAAKKIMDLFNIDSLEKLLSFESIMKETKIPANKRNELKIHLIIMLSGVKKLNDAK